MFLGSILNLIITLQRLHYASEVLVYMKSFLLEPKQVKIFTGHFIRNTSTARALFDLQARRSCWKQGGFHSYIKKAKTSLTSRPCLVVRVQEVALGSALPRTPVQNKGTLTVNLLLTLCSLLSSSSITTSGRGALALQSVRLLHFIVF